MIGRKRGERLPGRNSEKRNLETVRFILGKAGDRAEAADWGEMDWGRKSQLGCEVREQDFGWRCGERGAETGGADV